MTNLQDITQRLKNDMKLDYLKGMTAQAIADKYGYKDRSIIYYYIRPLSPEEKAEHARNRARIEEVRKDG